VPDDAFLRRHEIEDWTPEQVFPAGVGMFLRRAHRLYADN